MRESLAIGSSTLAAPLPLADDGRQSHNGLVADQHDSESESQAAAEEIEDIFTDTGSTQRPPNAYLKATLLSRLFFYWPTQLLRLGMERPLTEQDIPQIATVESSTYNLNMLEQLWNNEMERVKRYNKKLDRKGDTKTKRKKPSLHRALLKNFFTSIWYVQPMMCATVVARVVQSVALGILVQSFERENSSRDGYLWATILMICGAVILFEHHHVFFITWRKGMQLRIACVAAIFAKSLRLKSIGGIDKASSGKIMNLASNDVERFLVTALFISYAFWAPVQSIAVLVVGLLLLGPAFAAGFGLLICFFVPLQVFLSNRFATFRSKVAAITDARVTLVSQAVAGARVMKMSGWEWQFNERIAEIRRTEVKQIGKANRMKALNEAVFFATNVVIAIVVFLVHVAIGGELTPRNVFTTLSLINVLQIEMTKHVSIAVMSTSECYVSVSRIQKFLEAPELNSCDKPIPAAKSQNTSSETAVLLSNVTCFWSGKGGNVGGCDDQSSNESNNTIIDANANHSDAIALDAIDLELRMNQLTCIIGLVGSGKSALIQVLAGELPTSSGKLDRFYSSLAYASQDPWIMDGTVRENILLGLPFKKNWYNKVVVACGLVVDFEQFRDGDATIVGDRGVQCSGGQRARIGLARALYRDADVLFLDDPLSAVDSKVGRLIFYSAIQDLGVKRGKCVVLATHQHQFIGDSRCVLMSNGRILCDGSYAECVSAGGDTLTMTAHNADDREHVAENGEKVAVDGVENGGLISVIRGEEENHEANGLAGDADVPKNAADDYKEMNVTGIVKVETFLNYARAMGGVWVGVALLVLFSITQASVLVCIAAIGKWAELLPEDQTSPSILGIVGGLGAAVVVLALVRAFTSFALTMRASKRLHDRMTKSVLRAKIEFFDTNPVGRILNRFSADVGSNDDLLPQTLFDFFVIAFLVIGAIVTAVSVLPFTLIAIPPLLWYFVRVRRMFVTTTRELKRLEGLARSPIFAMMSESLSGIAVIRANGAVKYFREKFERAHDAHSRAFFSFIASSRWIGFRMDSLMFVFLSVASFLAVLFNDQDWFELDAAILGLALTMILQLAGLFQWCIRQSAEVVNLMVGVERVLGFGNLPSEGSLESENDSLAPNWPQEGSVEVKDLSVRYRPSLPPSLNNVTFRIESGSRVGIVGRTGSGKSTLVQALFRILEAEKGSIFVDDVDISTLGLHKVRMGMSVIPQFPVLFSGCTVRENLDPFHKYDDVRIRKALADVHMMRAIEDLPEGLESMVAEGGSNFSVGQRQLLCLARAILRKNRILVLDEPTANVDSRTDELLQKSVAKSFNDATIISVAHRLDTVIESDRILVLGHGKVLEYGAPRELLSSQEGHFASMVHDTGDRMSRELRRRASSRNF